MAKQISDSLPPDVEKLARGEDKYDELSSSPESIALDTATAEEEETVPGINTEEKTQGVQQEKPAPPADLSLPSCVYLFLLPLA